MYRRQLAQPVHSVQYIDLTGDGLNELVCLTFDAVYIFQVRLIPSSTQGSIENVEHLFRDVLDLRRGKRSTRGRPCIEYATLQNSHSPSPRSGSIISSGRLRSYDSGLSKRLGQLNR